MPDRTMLNELTATFGSEAAAASQSILALLMETTADAVFIKDLHGRYVTINGAAARFIGRPREEILGRDDTAFLPPDAAGNLMAQDAAVMAASRVQSWEEELTFDGESRTFLVTKGPLRSDAGDVVGLFGIARDITTQKQIHAELTASELKNRMFFDHSNIGISVRQLSGDADVNGGLCAMLGYTREELRGLHWRDFTHPDDVALSQRELDRLMSGESNTARLTKRLLRRDGTVLWADLTSNLCRDASGKPLFLVTAIIDITGRVLAEEALRKSDAKFRSVFDQSPIGKSITKLNGEVEFNPAMCRMLGYTPDELRHVRFQELTHPDDVELSEREARLLLTEGEQQRSFVKRYLRKDGSVMWAGVTASVRRGADGQPLDLLAAIIDITDRHAAEQKLQESEARYRTLIEWTPEPLMVHVDRKVVYVNPAAREMLRCPSRDLIIGTSVFDWITDEGRPLADQRVRMVLELGVGDALPMVEHRMRAYDGTPLLVEAQSVMVPYDGATAVCSALRDVTAQRQRDREMRESNYLFRESQRAAHIGSYRADFIAGRWQSSEALDAIFGIDASYERDIPGWLSLIHPDDRDAMAAYLQEEVIGSGRAFDQDYRIVRRSDGAVRWVHGTGALEYDPTGQVIAMTGTIQDSTERREASEELRRGEERYRTILATAMDGFWVVDMEGRILEVNETYARMSGYTVDELLTMRIADVDAGEAPEVTAARIAEIKAHGQSRFAVRHRRKDGSLFDVEVSTQYRPMDGGRMVAFLRDITASKQSERDRASMQAQLQQAQKMESVGRLAGGVAHDFNNMLGVILGNVDMALEQVALGDPLRADLEEARRAAVRSVDLTRQLLAFARKQTAAPQVLDLNATVAGMLRMLQRLIGEDIELAWRPRNDLWRVRVDPSQLDQVLANLCVNSRDAISGVGRISIETEQRTLTAADLTGRTEAAPGDYVVLTVSDDGVGMDEDTLSHLFEPFYTTKSQGRGTGLGLATVWGIVRQNNGFVEVTSVPGRGTTFRIYLPRHLGSAAQGPADGAPSELARGRETILLAEDEPAILSLTARMLERQGYRVLRAGTPGEAMRLAHEHEGEIHLVLSDVVMPEMNGRDLAKHLLTLYPNMKRMFMSGYTADVIAHRGVLDDGVNFIQKPFTQETLARKVREALDRAPPHA